MPGHLSYRQHLPRSAATLATLCAATLLGCASTTPLSEEDALVERANQYLAARQGGDVDTAYRYLAPSLRAILSKEQFANQYGESTTHLQGGTLHSVNCEEERCTLRRHFTLQNQVIFLKDTELSSYINEIWVKEEDQWWFLKI